MFFCAEEAVLAESAMNEYTRAGDATTTAAGSADRDERGQESAAVLLRSILDSQSELICRWRADGVIVFVNEAYCRFFGRRRAELLDSRWQPEVGPCDEEVVRAQLARLSAAHPLACIERRVRAANGDLVWLRHIYRGIFDASDTLAAIQAVAHDIDDQKRIEHALHDAQALLEFRVAERTRALRELATQITASEDRERRAIADDLHDDLGQILHVMKLKIELLKGDAAVSDIPPLSELDELVGRASRRVRSLTSQLGARIIDEFGPCGALRWLCDEMTRVYGLQVQAQIDSLPRSLSPAVGSLLFRGVRELLVNVARHAGTDTAFLAVRSNGNVVQVVVEDRGRGDGAGRKGQQPAGHGLSSLRERLLVLGGVLRVEDRRAAGFRVEFLLPVHHAPVQCDDGGLACRSD